MPWPRPVEPSFSRANRLSNTWLRATLLIVLEQQADLLEHALLAGHVEVERGRCDSGSSLAIRFMSGVGVARARRGSGYSAALVLDALRRRGGVESSFPCA